MEKYKHKDDALDILDENGEKTGESKTYTEVHRDALPHRTVHVWILNSKGEILLQKRAQDVAIYPNTWDISATGHIHSGQPSVEAAQMEMMEELGLYLPLDKFEHLFTVRENAVFDNGTYLHTENAFNDVYLVNLDVSVDELKLAKDEVSDIKWVSMQKLKELTENKDSTLTPHYEEYEKFLEYFDTIK